MSISNYTRQTAFTPPQSCYSRAFQSPACSLFSTLSTVALQGRFQNFGFVCHALLSLIFLTSNQTSDFPTSVNFYISNRPGPFTTPVLLLSTAQKPFTLSPLVCLATPTLRPRINVNFAVKLFLTIPEFPHISFQLFPQYFVHFL